MIIKARNVESAIVRPNAVPENDFIPRIGAGCLGVVGVVIGILGVASLRSAGAGLEGLLFGITLGGGFLAAGIFWYRFVATQERARRELFEEKAMLSVALNHEGFVTLAHALLETPFTAAQAESAMARLCRQGLARPEFLPDGTITYRFGGLLDD